MIHPRNGGLAAILIVLSSLLSACSGLQNNPARGWPADLPPLSFFVNAYEQDEALHALQPMQTYLYWVRKFYEGTTLYPRGWNDVSQDILAETAEPERIPARRKKLYSLGRDIAAEWSKESGYGRVENRHLAVWSVATSRAVSEGNVDATLSKISKDLDKLLSRDIAADEITAGRYHEQDPDDWFAF